MLQPFGFDVDLLPAFTGQFTNYKWVFFAITQLGSPFTLALLATLGFLLGKSKIKVFSAILLIGLIFTIVIVDDIKELAQRPRPDGAKDADFVVMDSCSFPSAHAAATFLAASLLGAYFGWRLYAAGYLLAFIVSLSRLFLGVHYPSDIVAGAAIGILLGELAVYAAYRFGLCGSPGLLRVLLRRPVRPVRIGIVRIDLVLSIVLFVTLVSAIVFYFLDYGAFAIFVLAAAILFIVVHVVSSGVAFDNDRFTAFTLLAIGIIAAIALLYTGSFALSLVVIAVAYAAVLGLKLGGKVAEKV